ncbi:putative RTA1 domain protein [Amniculicola lignicola CBS 123094]|uniref:Putative RTA1 domain protein n=1 Tax=Amniculicola lignicola CBS 123094 TaxID=1392246 RepID=A0A6A5W1D6_9PLEO|nr:putative RTA1 domain protein [Amniculicola lignicola CBS 123094]
MDPVHFHNLENCTLTTCLVTLAQVQYAPSLAGNALYISLFGLEIFTQVLFSVRGHTWGFMVSMLCGLVLEIVGYVARIRMHFNPAKKAPFAISGPWYLVAITLGPTFFTASIYICLPHIIAVDSESLSRFRPRTYTLGFITSDIVSLVLQAHKKQTGIDVMIAGLAFQVASLVLFMLLCVDFVRVICKTPGSKGEDSLALRNGTWFGGFLWSLAFSTLFIFSRCMLFRVVEVWKGFGSTLANNEVTFMVLEGGVVAAAVVLLTVLHPGVAFGRLG